MKKEIIAAILILLCIALMPARAVCAQQQEAISLADGEYKVDVELSGGSGKASITSPATVIVENGTAIARIEWSSSNYDYMIVDGEKYLPVNTDGNSVFEIPVLSFDSEMTVIADTTAMSVPHEIEYTLVFDGDSAVLAQAQDGGGIDLGLIFLLAIAMMTALVMAALTMRRQG